MFQNVTEKAKKNNLLQTFLVIKCSLPSNNNKIFKLPKVPFVTVDACAIKFKRNPRSLACYEGQPYVPRIAAHMFSFVDVQENSCGDWFPDLQNLNIFNEYKSTNCSSGHVNGSKFIHYIGYSSKIFLLVI